MSRALLAAAVRFAQHVDRCSTPDEVLIALHKAVSPAANAFGVWPVPRDVKRGKSRRYQVYLHPDVPAAYLEEFWPQFEKHGTSFFGCYAPQAQRDVTLSEAIRAMKPSSEELWIVRHNLRFGIAEAMYIPSVDSWRAVLWWPKRVRLDEGTRKALRIAGDAAARRVEQIVGRQDVKEDPRLSRQERDVLRLLKDDKTEQQVARLLNLHVGTIKQCVRRAKRKLGTTALRDTIAEAVRRYVVLGLAGTLACADLCELTGELVARRDAQHAVKFQLAPNSPRTRPASPPGAGCSVCKSPGKPVKAQCGVESPIL